MTNVEILDGRADARGGYKVDVSRGTRVGRVSSEWFSHLAERVKTPETYNGKIVPSTVTGLELAYLRS